MNIKEIEALQTYFEQYLWYKTFEYYVDEVLKQPQVNHIRIFADNLGDEDHRSAKYVLREVSSRDFDIDKFYEENLPENDKMDDLQDTFNHFVLDWGDTHWDRTRPPIMLPAFQHRLKEFIK